METLIKQLTVKLWHIKKAGVALKELAEEQKNSRHTSSPEAVYVCNPSIRVISKE